MGEKEGGQHAGSQHGHPGNHHFPVTQAVGQGGDEGTQQRGYLVDGDQRGHRRQGYAQTPAEHRCEGIGESPGGVEHQPEEGGADNGQNKG